MNQVFNIGTFNFHAEPNMNYQFNRVHTVFGGDLNEIREVSRKIKTLDDWKREFLNLAETAIAENRFMHAAAYYRGANFYISPNDPDKKTTYDQYVNLIHDIHREKFETGVIKVFKIPYENAYLPVWHVNPEDREDKRNVVVMHLGFDAVKEELIPILDIFRAAGLKLFLFEGPGQGETLIKNNIFMTHEFEKPVKAVLDFFNLDDVTLIGLSLGGYLAPRAAIHEKRIQRVIAWGVMYDFLDTVLSRRGKFLEVLLKTLLRLKASAAINTIASLKMKKDPYAKWGIEHGMYVLGAQTPYAYFRRLRRYSMRTISHLVRQDFLLITGTQDHFVPLSHYHKQAEKLVNVRSFTGRIFTKHERAENHVQFGNIPLVVGFMINWIKERTAALQNDIFDESQAT
ncbi:MAG: alpha/beta fold hydrolase [Pseudomonadota bacterium]